MNILIYEVGQSTPQVLTNVSQESYNQDRDEIRVESDEGRTIVDLQEVKRIELVP